VTFKTAGILVTIYFEEGSEGRDAALVMAATKQLWTRTSASWYNETCTKVHGAFHWQLYRS
jgi:hypothetical protein